MVAIQARVPVKAQGAVRKPSDFKGYFLIPLAEFGKSLDSPDLDVWFEGFAERNKDSVGDFEITAQGELRIMPPTGFPGEWFELEMAAAVLDWSRNHGGRAGGPTGRFILPDGARIGPDAYWISNACWNALPEEARTPPFAAVVPEFIVEIVSPSNSESELRKKVSLYLEGDALLVWVIYPFGRVVTIHRPGAEPEILHEPDVLGGGDVLPGFAFNVRQRIFDNVP